MVSFSSLSRSTCIAIVGGVCLLFMVIIIAWRNVRSVVSMSGTNSESISVPASCDQAKDPEICEAQRVAIVAAENGDAKACKDLTGQMLENCVRLVVQEVGKDSACSMLDGEAEDRCRGDILLREALEKLEAKLCEDIVNDRDQKACEEAVLSQSRLENVCDAKDGADEECAILLLYRQAVEKGDRKLCDQIEREETHDACVQAVKEQNDRLEGTDSDKDGLIWEDEREIGTDPDKADTDGDGYVDGEEVKGGFNPLGEGRLNTTR